MLRNKSNRTVRREVLEQSSRSTFKLDVLIAESTVWPTWTKCPAALGCIEELEVTLRIPRGFDLYGVHDVALLPLFQFLNRVFQQGPHGLNSDSPAR